MKQAHRHVDTRWEFSREGARVYCRDCKRWRTTIETGFDPGDGHLLGPWPNPPEGSFQYQMDKLRRQVEDLGWAILEATPIPRLVDWLDMLVLRWRLMINIRRHHRQFKTLRVGDLQEFLKKIGMTEEQFKSIRKDVR